MKLLLITPYFPPANTIASHRLYSFARYLPQQEIDVEVVTPDRPGNLTFDLNGIVVHRTHRDTTAVNAFSRTRGSLRELVKHTGIRALRYYSPTPFVRSGLSLFDHKELKRFDAVMASFSTEDALRLAYLIHTRYGLPLLIDYRDLWLDNRYATWKPMDKLIIYHIEKNLVHASSLVTTVSQTLSEQLRQRYGIDAVVIYNGFFSFNRNPSPVRQPKSNTLRLCYCGSLYGGLRPIHALFPYLAKHPSLYFDIAVLDATDAAYVNRLIKEYDLASRVSLYIDLAHEKAIALEQQADVLVLLNTVDGEGKGVLSGKFFEYMGAGKFILGIGHPEDEAADLIRRYNLGIYTDGKTDFFHRIDLSEWKPPDAETLARFDRKNQAFRLANEIKKALAPVFG
ncbi:glycosyltransferase [candidate division KSB1 bacterium]|nr:glycosyltransferase [candidate division KSB1 bacterium]